MLGTANVHGRTNASRAALHDAEVESTSGESIGKEMARLIKETPMDASQVVHSR